MKIATLLGLSALLTIVPVPVAAPGPSRSSDGEVTAARAEAIARTRSEIEELIERYGGRNEIHFEMEAFREEVQYVIEEQASNGVRTFHSGGNDFGKAISTSAVKPEWYYEWDASRGDVAARAAIIDFDRKLKAIGVDLIVIPVPSKIEAYTREFETEMTKGIPISLPRLDEMLYLLDNDIEVVDVLPTVLALMTDDDEVPVYETTGHHISGLGVRSVGALVAERLARYGFEGRDLARFSDAKRLAGERITPSVPMYAWEVLEDGEPYQHVPLSPVIIMGDSNAFAYKKASWASHVARAAGIPVTDISTSSGGPTAHARLAGQGLAMLKQRKVVIWVISATHMERRPWRTADIQDEPSFEGLLGAGLIDEAIAMFEARDDDTARIKINEDDVNATGYELVQSGKLEQAAQLFEINTLVFPHSANAFDSLGETHMKLGENEKAIACFKKALSLNPPANTRANSLKLLAQLGVDYEAPSAYELTAKAMEALVGEYDLSENNKGIVSIVEGGLVFEFVGQPKMAMSPLSDVLFTTEPGIKIEFTPASTETPLAVVLSGMGMRFEGRKR
jgi:tetratricopeptide (TPR) repeat protein